MKGINQEDESSEDENNESSFNLRTLHLNNLDEDNDIKRAQSQDVSELIVGGDYLSISLLYT